MRAPKFGEAVGAALAAVAVGVVAHAAFMGNEQALGALIAVVSAAVTYYLRGKVQESS